MRKVLIAAVGAVSALGMAAPASAQWAPPVYQYQPYSFGNHYNGRAFARSMQVRVERIRSDIRAMQVRRILSFSEARSLDAEAAQIQRRIYRASRNGIQAGEARNVEHRIRRLENRISREASDWNNRPSRRHH
jgi:hypothetical protein